MAGPTEPDDDDLVAALGRLPREAAPPPEVGAALARSVHGRSAPWRGWLWQGAVAASLAGLMFFVGRLTAPVPPAPAAPATPPPAAGISAPRFAFLLYGGAPSGADDRAAEYGAWAGRARRDGRTVSGERLADAAWTAGAPLAEPAPLRGFFIVQAADADEALELARRHPHAQDGTVVVRPIDTPGR